MRNLPEWDVETLSEARKRHQGTPTAPEAPTPSREYKARFETGADVRFTVSVADCPDAQDNARYKAEPLAEDGRTLREVYGQIFHAFGSTPEFACMAVFNPGAVLEVVPADEPYRAELLKFWREHGKDSGAGT